MVSRICGDGLHKRPLHLLQPIRREKKPQEMQEVVSSSISCNSCKPFGIKKSHRTCRRLCPQASPATPAAHSAPKKGTGARIATTTHCQILIAYDALGHAALFKRLAIKCCKLTRCRVHKGYHAKRPIMEAVHAYMHAFIHAYMHTCRHAYMHTCIHAYMHTCIHAYMYIHTYIHTYIRARIATTK
jgi:hypothetical protein